MEANKALVKSESSAYELIKVSEVLFKSQLFPNVRNSFGAYAVVQYGAELEIPPMTALQTMSIISGKICMAAQMMLTLALKKGVSYKVLSDSDKEVSVTFSRQGFEPYTSSFSIEEAKRAGIFKAQGGWEKWPRDMCFWRAVTRGLRRIAPDIVLGLYAIEEIKDAPPLNEPVEAEIITQHEQDVKQEGQPPESSPVPTGILIKTVTKQDKKKDGTPMKNPRYIIRGENEGEEYYTFDIKLAEFASKNKETGFRFKVEFEDKDKFGKELKSLSNADQPPEGAEEQ